MYAYSRFSLKLAQTWLDERLFGWSRSAWRGTSAWSGTRSQDISRAPSPDASEDETGDYDNVLGYLEGRSAQSPRTGRSHQSSYADLQRLRSGSGSGANDVKFAARSTAPEVNESAGGIQMRQRGSSRTRKSSLSDSVPVERIGALDRDETFREATEDLNHELQEQKEHKDE